jgi:predicted HicB family RNase H-like nuclease
MKNKTMKQKTIHISEELHKKLKMEAIKVGMPLRFLVEEKLKQPFVKEKK